MNINAIGHISGIIRFAKKANRYCCSIRLKLLLTVVVLINVIIAPTFAVNTHYIIAFDRHVGNYHKDFLSPKMLTTLTKILKKADFSAEKDYISIVEYSMEMDNPSMDKFVRPYVSSKGDTITWLKLADENLSALFRKWSESQPLINTKSKYSSLQSLAKPFIMMEVQTEVNSAKYADRTIMLLVTDEVVNGADDNYAQEWETVSISPGSNNDKFESLKHRVFSQMQKFNDEFKFVEIALGRDNQTRVAISPDGKYKVVLYEVVAVDKPSIHSVTDFPSPLPLQRVRGGFKVSANTQSINKKYEIHQIAIAKTDGQLLGKVSDGDFDLIIHSDDVHAGDTLATFMSLRMIDGFYNGTLISADNPRYTDGMVSQQVVKIQDEAKILGLFPLTDFFWWWFPNDVFTAVMIWDLIILIIAIVIVGYVLYKCFVKINTYKPSNETLKITKI